MAKKCGELGEDIQAASARELEELIVEQGFTCRLSGVALQPEVAAVDHIVAVSDGGSDSIENLAIVHREVNRMKGNLSLDEFVEWCRKVVGTADASR